MATLIITIVAIVLALALALVTIYYGSTAWTKASDNAVAASYLTGAQQIEGAVKLYTVEHTGMKPGSLDDLKNGNYLRSNLEGTWSISGDYVVSKTLTDAQCLKVDQKLGLTSTPACDDPTYKGQPVCCTTDSD